MSSQALTQFPLENDLGLLRRTTAEKTASPKKSNKKTLDKKLARLATAPVKPVAGANAGPAKIASRASRKGDLSLLRRTTKEKTASMKKTAYMEKRAAAKRGLAQVLEKNAMVKEAAIQLMVKEAFMCELYRIEEATGDWRLSHSLAFQEDKILEEFEKQAFIRALGAGISAGAKSGWKGFQLARAGGQGFGQAVGAGMRQAAPAFTAARTAKAGALQVAKNVKDTAKVTAKATKASEKAVKPATKARDAAVAESRAAGASPEATRLAGQEAYTGTTAASKGALSEAQLAEQAAKKAATPAPAFEYSAKGKMLPSGGRQSRNARKARQKAIKTDYLATQREIARTKGTVMTPAQTGAKGVEGQMVSQPLGQVGAKDALRRGGGHGPKTYAERTGGMSAAQQERQIMIANAERAGKGGLAGKGAATSRPAGAVTAEQRTAQAATDRAARAKAGDQTAKDIISGKAKGKGPIQAGPEQAVKKTKDVKGGAEGGGEGILGGKTFTEGTMPTWMPKGVSDKWAALTPEQRRLWAIGGAAGAGGLTAGAVLG
jgi:hypothetical protein